MADQNKAIPLQQVPGATHAQELPGNHQEQHQQQPPPDYYSNTKGAAPQQQQTRAPGQPMQQQQQHGVVPLQSLGEGPQWIDCPFCHQRTQTVVSKHGGSKQFVVGAVLCLICVCLACVPCIAGWFEDTEYHCGNCKNLVASRPDGGIIQVFGPAQPSVYGANGIQQQPQPHPQPSAVPPAHQANHIQGQQTQGIQQQPLQQQQLQQGQQQDFIHAQSQPQQPQYAAGNEKTGH